MRQYLVFTIAAPMASFGMKYDPGEWRNSSNRPSKSGVLGLIAAALGVEREEQGRFDALRDSLGFAVRVEQPGQPAYDYHTSQVPPQKRNRRFATRADELAVPKPELKTILSTREFRVNAFSTAALWLRPANGEAPTPLEGIADALRRPRFTLYAGRKSHPLMLPCAPETVEAEDALRALEKYDAAKPGIHQFKHDRLTARNEKAAPAPVFYCELDDPAAASAERREQRRDLPESRTKWRFGIREEAVLAPRGGRG